MRGILHATLAVILTLSASSPAFAQDAPQDAPETPIPNWFECVQGLAAPGPSGEIYGPTAINAQSANQGLSIAVDDHGTVTVFRWPRPSFYDQIKYRTSSRSAEHLGALPNEGSFLGLAIAEGGDKPTRTIWLRDLRSTMQHPDQRSDVIETVYDGGDLGLEITVRDVVVHDLDALARQVTVEQTADSPVTAASLVAFENFNLVVDKYPYFPVSDWCFEEKNDDSAAFDADVDAVVHTVQGVDSSTGTSRSAAAGLALGRPSTQHQVGGDAHEGTSTQLGKLPGPTQDAYEDAADGSLNGGARFAGQTTGALMTDLDLSGGRDVVTAYLAGGTDAAEVTRVLDEVRKRPFRRLVEDKHDWFADLLAEAPLPNTADAGVLALANRALVTLVSVFDPGSGAIVASIATQSPYGEDWPRDGAFFNHVLDLIGRHDWVAQRTEWYAELQAQGSDTGSDNPAELNPFIETQQAAFVPPGNWAMNYYADGVPGGPIPWEIDETGYTLWLFWDHYEATRNRENLEAVYPAIRRAADFLTDWKDPQNGLHAPAWEDDNPQPKQTIHGAGPVWLGLDSAVRAAEALGQDADAARWAARRQELRKGIENTLYVNETYGGGNGVIVWPICFHPYDHPRFADAQYNAIWQRLASTFEEPQPGPPHAGLYESKGLISLAKATKGRPEWTDRVRRGLTWIAEHHAEPGTHIMGEEWFNQDGTVISTVSQPHVWEQVLFYLGALEAWPPEGFGGVEHRNCAGTVGALRQAALKDGQPAPAPPTDAPPTEGPAGPQPSLPATGGGLLPVAVGLAALTLVTRGRRR